MEQHKKYLKFIENKNKKPMTRMQSDFAELVISAIEQNKDLKDNMISVGDRVEQFVLIQQFYKNIIREESINTLPHKKAKI